LTCLDDLPLHVGLMELLADEMLQCRLVLRLPTQEAVRLARARARREEWHMLVEILEATDCDNLVRSFAADTPIAVFAYPSLLPSCGDSGTQPDPPEGRCRPFRGKVGDYLTHTVDCAPELVADDARTLRQLITLDPDALPKVSDHTASQARAACAAAGTQPPVALEGGAIEIPDLGANGELTIAAIDAEGKANALVRRLGTSREDRLRVRMPARFLTVTPQRVRIDARDADTLPIETDVLFQVPPSQIQPWMLSAFLNRGGAGNPVIRAFAASLGCRLAYAEDEPEMLRDIPVVWGVLRGSDRILARAKAEGLYFFYIDHAYFNRGHGKTYRITRNGYEAGAIRRCPRDRLEELNLQIRPWRKSGRQIILCPPTEHFMEAHGCEDWLDSTLATLRKVTDRPIVIRQKPKPGEVAVPLSEALETAHAMVTHSSNVAIEAACLGTPVFVSPTSAAAPIGTTDLSKIEKPAYPDRSCWLAHLAYNQFSFEEIADGRAWRMLLELEERDLV
jgi:hypothetical protein